MIIHSLGKASKWAPLSMIVRRGLKSSPSSAADVLVRIRSISLEEVCLLKTVVLPNGASSIWSGVSSFLLSPLQYRKVTRLKPLNADCFSIWNVVTEMHFLLNVVFTIGSTKTLQFYASPSFFHDAMLEFYTRLDYPWRKGGGFGLPWSELHGWPKKSWRHESFYSVQNAPGHNSRSSHYWI